MFRQASRLDILEAHDVERPTKAELREVAIKVEDRISRVERAFEDLDTHGSRILSERIAEIGNRLIEVDRRIQVLDAVAKEGIPAIVRQAETLRRLDEIERQFHNFSYPRGPTGPTNYPSQQR